MARTCTGDAWVRVLVAQFAEVDSWGVLARWDCAEPAAAPKAPPEPDRWQAAADAGLRQDLPGGALVANFDASRMLCTGRCISLSACVQHLPAPDHLHQAPQGSCRGTLAQQQHKSAGQVHCHHPLPLRALVSGGTGPFDRRCPGVEVEPTGCPGSLLSVPQPGQGCCS